MHIAIIGGGVSGLVAAYLLQRQHHVELFEARDTLGGHANTVVTSNEAGEEVALDVGFVVYNQRTYPVFSQLLRELNVETRPSDMSFGVSSDVGDFEYSSRGWRGYLGSPSNLFSIRRAIMGLDVLRFQRSARDVFRFLDQHGVLALHSIPEWRWIVGGARKYVEAILRTIDPTRIHAGTRITGVTRQSGGACVRLTGGEERHFDAVVLACHADQALALLSDHSPEEREALGGFAYARNHVVLHTDERILPRRSSARAAWNYHRSEREGVPKALTMSYDLNRLQGLSGPTTYCVSVNPGANVDPARVIAEFDYAHPVYSLRTLEAQQRLRALQGQRQTYFAGAHLGYGFHEDGARSGMEVAHSLGVDW